MPGDIRDAGSTPGSGRSPGGGHGSSFQYSCLENPTDRGAWPTTVHRVTQSWTWLKWLSMYTYSFLEILGRDLFPCLWFFLWSCMDVRVGLWRRLSTKELMLLNCGVGEDSRVPWTARRPNQSILKEISTEYSLEGLMLKLKLQYFGHLIWRTNSFENKDPDAGKDWGQEEKGTTEDEMVGWHHWCDRDAFE